MSPATRGHRAGRTAVLGLLLAGGLLATWGVPIDVQRVARLVPPDQPIRLRAERARLALRPLPTIVASGVRVSVSDRVDAAVPSAAIVLGLARLLRGDPSWSRARLRGGRVVVRPTAGGEPIGCAGVRGRLAATGATGARLDLRGDCAGRGWELAALRYRGDVDWRDVGVARSTGRVIAEAPRVGGLVARRLVAGVRSGRDGVRARPVRLEVGDGAVLGHARWLRLADRHRVAWAFEGTGAAAEEAFADAALRVTGRWVVRGRGRAVARAGAPLARGVSGRGRLVLLEGSVEPLDVGGALLDGLEVWRGRRRGRLRKRFPDVLDGPGLRFDRAAIGIHARRGRYRIVPVRVRSRSYTAEGEGRLRRDGSVRGELRVVPSRPLADALVGRGALRAILAGEGVDVVLPLEVTGRPGDLHVRPARAFARQILERALGDSALRRTLDRLLDR